MLSRVPPLTKAAKRILLTAAKAPAATQPTPCASLPHRPTGGEMGTMGIGNRLHAPKNNAAAAEQSASEANIGVACQPLGFSSLMTIRRFW